MNNKKIKKYLDKCKNDVVVFPSSFCEDAWSVTVVFVRTFFVKRCIDANIYMRFLNRNFCGSRDFSEWSTHGWMLRRFMYGYSYDEFLRRIDSDFKTTVSKIQRLERSLANK